MEGAADFGRLPGGCFSYILSLTSPRDACTCSAVSSFFRSAAQADAVWERFLPSDYLEILARSDGTVEFSSKKELYFRLCTTPILIDGGKIVSFLCIHPLVLWHCFSTQVRRNSILHTFFFFVVNIAQICSYDTFFNASRQKFNFTYFFVNITQIWT